MGRSRAYASAAFRRPAVGSRSSSASGSPLAVKIVSAITASSPALISSTSVIPPATTTAPPAAGPAMNATEKAPLRTALPSRSNPWGVVTATVVARAIERAVSAAIPSIAARMRTVASAKREVIDASARNSADSVR